MATTTTPAGWDTASWGEYKGGTNDFSTVAKKYADSGDTASAAKVEAARNAYIDSQGGSVKGSNGTTYKSTYKYTTDTSGSKTQTGTGTGTGTGTVAANGNTQTTTSTAPSGWNTAEWGEYKAGTNDFSTVLAGNTLTSAQKKDVETARNAYIDEMGYDQSWKTNDYQNLTTTYKIRSVNGKSKTGTVEYDPTTGAINVTFENNATPSALDYVELDNGLIGFYVDDDESQGWVTGTEDDYANYVSWYTSAQEQAKMEAWMEAKQAEWDELQEQLIAQNEAATEISVNEIIAQLENGLSNYDVLGDEAYLQKMQNQDALVMQNAAAGNTGGVAQKQYSASEANYDNQLLSIALERQNFINTCEQTIAQLEAEGRYNEATILSDWAQAKIADMDAAYKWVEELKFQKEQFAYEKETTDRNYYFQRAASLLEQGLLTTDALEALGISEADAKAYVNRLNTEANINLEAAQLQLKALYNEVNGSSGSGSSGYSGGVDLTGGDDYAIGDTQVVNGNTYVYDGSNWVLQDSGSTGTTDEAEQKKTSLLSWVTNGLSDSPAYKDINTGWSNFINFGKKDTSASTASGIFSRLSDSQAEQVLSSTVDMSQAVYDVAMNNLMSNLMNLNDTLSAQCIADYFTCVGLYSDNDNKMLNYINQQYSSGRISASDRESLIYLLAL